jgi:multiple sugar transport system substrate-binding protein
MGSHKRSGVRRRDFLQGTGAIAGAAVAGALPRRARAQSTGRTEIVFASAPFFTAKSIAELMDAYNGAQNAVHATYLELPSAADGVALQRQLVALLKSKGRAPDVFSLDLVRVAEVAAAGFALPLGAHFSAADMRGFFPGIVEGCTLGGQLVAMPWFADSGMLFSRTDILERIGADVPQTWDDLVSAAARGISSRTPYGFLWQGKKSEAFVCNLVSLIGSNGGRILDADGVTVRIAEPEAVAAVQFLHDTINSSHISPRRLLSWDEEPCRKPFNAGQAVFLRNWSYTWGLAQQKGSAVAGRISVSPLPHFPGKASAACLGGFQFCVNASSRNRDAAVDFLRWLSSRETQLRFATVDGLAPTRRAVFDDPALAKAQPFLARLKDVFVGAVARPVTPRYPEVTKVIQAEARRAVTRNNVAAALSAAKARIEAILAA